LILKAHSSTILSRQQVNMPLFKTAATPLAALLASFATSNAYVTTYTRSPSRHSAALTTRLRPSFQRSAAFSPEVDRVMQDFDRMFDSVLRDAGPTFYAPLAPRRAARRSPLLPPRSMDRALARVPRATYETSQDENEVKIVFAVPGASADDIKLELNDEDYLLRISGKTTFEDDNLSVSSNFDRSFKFEKDVDMRRVSAKFADGVFTVTAPKVERKEKHIRSLEIDVVESPDTEGTPALADQEEAMASEDAKRKDGSANEASAQTAHEEVMASEDEKSKDDSLIDLDAVTN